MKFKLEKQHTLYLELLRRSMTICDAATFVEMSPTGVRNYLRELVQAGLANMVRIPETGPWIFSSNHAPLNYSKFFNKKWTTKVNRDGNFIARCTFSQSKPGEVGVFYQNPSKSRHVRRDPLVEAFFGARTPDEKIENSG